MKLGTTVVYFSAIAARNGSPCEPQLGTVLARPKSFPTLDVLSTDAGGSVAPQSGVPQAGSLQECIEIGNRWATIEQVEGWGVNLEDGDQVLEEIVTP